MTANDNLLVSTLEGKVIQLYKIHETSVPFHGWHHINFVRKKAVVFAKELSANIFITESSALVHDLNYLIKINSNPEEGADIRKKLLAESGYRPAEMNQIEHVILDAHTTYRHNRISLEAQALSDADTLFKALPVTPVLFARDYILENKITLSELATSIIQDQFPLFDRDIYFYTVSAKQMYRDWAVTNLKLWKNLLDCLHDTDVLELLSSSQYKDVI